MLYKKITFPKFSGTRCIMMPYIQGDINTIPDEYKTYKPILKDLYLEKGEIGFLTIDESFVQANASQRGYNFQNQARNVHIEVERYTLKNTSQNSWGGSSGGNGWGKTKNVLLDDNTEVLIANSVSDTCRYWTTIDKSETIGGDLSGYLDKYPENTGILLKAGEVAKISIFTPHECVIQKQAGPRQFLRIVGKGVVGREEYFTVNPLL